MIFRDDATVANPYVLVVGVKFDPSGEMTFREAIRFTDCHSKAILHLCNVVETPSPLPAHFASTRLQSLIDERAEMLQVFALNKNDSLAHPLRERIRLHVAAGDVARSLVRFACDTHADAIVVGSRSIAGDTGIVHGSVAARLSELSPCSVFLVRPSSYQGMPVAAVAEPDPFSRLPNDDEARPSVRFRRHLRLP